jgi:hypothetical protein
MDHRTQFPTMSAWDGDDTEVVVRTRDSAHGGEGGRILMCHFESTSASGEATDGCGMKEACRSGLSEHREGREARGR